MTDNDRRDRVENLKKRLFRCTAAIALTAGLTACESVPDELNPGVWFESVADTFSDEEEAGTQTASAPQGDYPNLSTVPDRPMTSIEERREALSRGLMAEDGETAYSSQDLKAESGAQTLAPPPEQAILRPDRVETPMPTQSEIAAANQQETGFRGAFPPLGGSSTAATPPSPMAQAAVPPAPVMSVSEGAQPESYAAGQQPISQGLAGGSQNALAQDPRYAGPSRNQPLVRPPEAPQPMMAEAPKAFDTQRPPLTRPVKTEVAQAPEPQRPPLSRALSGPVAQEPQRPPLERMAENQQRVPQSQYPPLVKSHSADPYADLAAQAPQPMQPQTAGVASRGLGTQAGPYAPAPVAAPAAPATPMRQAIARPQPTGQMAPVQVATAAPLGEPKRLPAGASEDPYVEYYKDSIPAAGSQAFNQTATPAETVTVPPAQAVGYVPPAMIQRQTPILNRRTPAPAALQSMPPFAQTVNYNPSFRRSAAQQPWYMGGVRVGTIYFEDGSSGLSRDDRDVLKKVAQIYREKGEGVLVMGHASYPTKARTYPEHELINFRISGQRADAVARHLVRLGVPRRAVRIGAFSDAQPEYQENRSTGIAGNRRVVLFLIPRG